VLARRISKILASMSWKILRKITVLFGIPKQDCEF